MEDGSGFIDLEFAEDVAVKRKNIYLFYQDALINNLKKETHIVYDGVEYTIENYSYLDEIKKTIKFKCIGA